MKRAILILVSIPLLLFAGWEENHIKKDRMLMEKVWANPTPPQERLSSFTKHMEMARKSPFRLLKWEELGPTIVEGRVVDIEPIPGKPFSFLVASASGGVWMTENNGTTFYPIFKAQATYTIGDIAVAPSNPRIIWVGTGENNSSRSSYAGTGIYKSTDGGKTWKLMGLTDSHHIGRIIVHPKNPDIVYVAVIGHLYTHDNVRGLYKTTDGGKHWEKLPIPTNRTTGVIDIAMNPSNPNELIAATWERDRRAWNFVESGEGSGLWKTTDGGKSWKRLTRGFPTGWFVGRIGISYSRSNPKIVYAVMDNQKLIPPRKVVKKQKGLTFEKLKLMSNEDFLKISDKELSSFLRMNRLPYSAKQIKKWVKEGKLTVKMIVEHINDAQRRLLETKVVGPEVYKSTDGGETWKKVNKDYIEGVFSTYGYYFGQIRVDPKNPDKVFILGVPLMVSNDGGKTWKRVNAKGVHADHHAMWIDPSNPARIIIGNDGGIDFSYDGGKTWKNSRVLPITQFYTVEVEQGKVPYKICGGTQDNGVLCSDNFRGPYSPPWKLILGGDGGFMDFDPSNPDVRYAAFQFGYIFRLENGKQKFIRPGLKPWEKPLRFNWITPFFVSKYNPLILYLGANRLMKSYDRGDRWYPISSDLTTNPPQGDVPYGTITAISESHFKPGRLYVGTDDGKVWFTDNDGTTWKEINSGLPKKWVTRIVASKYKEGRVYITLTGYRDDDFNTYVYTSDDFGKTWHSIKGNLPQEPLNVIREIGEGKLLLGSDFGIYLSMDNGKTWYSLRANLPTIPVYDLKYQWKAKEIVIATHGRGMWKLDGAVIENIKPEVFAKEYELTFVRDGLIYPFSMGYMAEPYPLKLPTAYIWSAKKTKAKIVVKNSRGKVLLDKEFKLHKKVLNPVVLLKKKLRPGEYTLTVTVGKQTFKKKFRVETLKGELPSSFYYKPESDS